MVTYGCMYDLLSRVSDLTSYIWYVVLAYICSLIDIKELPVTDQVKVISQYNNYVDMIEWLKAYMRRHTDLEFDL